jgi:type III restriction enzyme
VEIAVATGEQRELDGLNLFDKTCPVNYVITIEALKEGWDCSFAYVFCSVANIKSAVDVEQLLGRVMRMPYAKRRRIPELNSAYAHVIAPSFAEAADAMLNHLVNMGFDAEEAAVAIMQRASLPFLPGFEDLPLFRAVENLPQPNQPPILELELPQVPDLAALSEDERGQITVTPITTGGVAVVCTGPLSEDAEKAFIAAAPDRDGEIRRRSALYRARERQARSPSPSQQGRLFQVEQLKMELWSSLEPTEPEVMLAALDWTPLQNFQGLTLGEFVYDESARTFIFDLDGERMSYSLADRQQEFTLLVAASPFDETGLAVWLDEKCALPDVAQADMLEFCRRAVHSLLQNGAFDLGTLSRAKFALAVALKAKLESLRREALKQGLRQWLIAPISPLKISFVDPHQFPKFGYAENREIYKGAYRFQKHHYPDVRDLKSAGEEFACARIIDMHPQVESWLRNVDRAEGSFSLPLHDGKFYPDFVVKLKDGRTLVVEYKGEHLKDAPESLEKRTIGEFWARQDGGKNRLFLMAVAKDERGRDVERQISTVINV